MKTTAFAVSVLALLIAVAGVAGYVVVAHGSLPFASAPAPSSAGGVGTLNVYVTGTSPANATAGNETSGNQTAGNQTSGDLTVGNVTWSHVYVTFTLLQAHQANDTNDSGWRNISVSNTVDLLSVKTAGALLGSAQLPAGNYTQLRIVVEKAWGVTSNGQSYNFTVPSGVLKTDDPFTVSTGQMSSLTLDVNLSHSIVWTDMGYLFTPVIGSIQSS